MHASRNRTGDHSLKIPELPSLEPGLTLLETDKNVRSLLQTLAVDELLLSGGHALWVGTGRHCTTDTLAQIVPDRRVLERIEIARGFTPYQHTTLIQGLDTAVTEDSAVIVLPNIDARYRGDDVQGGNGQAMLVRALAPLARIARDHDIPILCTRTRDDAFAAPVEAAAISTLVAEVTPMGPRFIGEEFETLVYPLEGDWLQTTIAFWQRVLDARQPIHDAATWSTGVSAGGAN